MKGPHQLARRRHRARGGQPGHEVTAVGRNATRLSQIEGARAVVADLDDPESIVDAVKGSDVVVSSVTDRSRQRFTVGS
jgi:putative NADH-flavin reductase